MHNINKGLAYLAIAAITITAMILNKGISREILGFALGAFMIVEFLCSD